MQPILEEKYIGEVVESSADGCTVIYENKCSISPLDSDNKHIQVYLIEQNYSAEQFEGGLVPAKGTTVLVSVKMTPVKFLNELQQKQHERRNVVPFPRTF